MKIPINKEFSFVNFSLETHSLNGSSPKQSHHCKKKKIDLWSMSKPLLLLESSKQKITKQTKNNGHLYMDLDILNRP